MTENWFDPDAGAGQGTDGLQDADVNDDFSLAEPAEGMTEGSGDSHASDVDAGFDESKDG